jgi:quercetin dioxygenase-like cupin family protein
MHLVDIYYLPTLRFIRRTSSRPTASDIRRPWQRRAHTAQVIALGDHDPQPARRRTHALLKTETLELVHLVLPAGAGLPEHAAPGEITLFGLQGCLILRLRDRDLCLHAGDLVHLAPGEPHAVHAQADSRALLTLCLHRPPQTTSRVGCCGSALADDPGHGGSRHPLAAPHPGAGATALLPHTTF